MADAIVIIDDIINVDDKVKLLVTENETKTVSVESGDSKIHWVESLPECSICLERCQQPVKLPCTHIFCYLCAKGFVQLNKLCALCRTEVSLDSILDPVLVKVRGKDDIEKKRPKRKCTREKDEFLWFYEGRNGWWQYDERTSIILEEAFVNEEKSLEMMIAGNLYVIDLEKWVQYRKTNSSFSRSVKRAVSATAVKGVAGLKHAKIA